MTNDRWLETTIGEQATLQRGIDITREQQRPGEVPVISSGGISSFHDTAPVKGPGVVLGRKGVVGSVYFVREDYWPHDTTLWVKDFHGNEPRFVYYFFKHFAPMLANMDVGSANPTLNRNHVHPISISWPHISEQKAIAAVLGALDDKIELNRRMNATLEAIARALFQSWFVDFDPVRAKLDGRKPTGLDPATAALFPNEFEESELGPIPKGWRVGKAEEILTFSRNTLDPSNFPDELFAHYSLPAFDEGRVPKLELGSAIKSQKLAVRPDAVLLSKLNPHIPRIWLPDLTTGSRAICSTEFLVAQPKDGVSREFLFCLFTSGIFASEYATLVTGTTGSHQRVRGDSVLEMKIVIPPIPLLDRFSASAKPNAGRLARGIRESATLAAIRDTLLPKLLSGELTVKTNQN
jgi:type I restriction enzyme, S subunit